MNILLPQFSDFMSVMRQFTIECRLCSISASCRCTGGGHAHVQGRTASGDSSAGKNISLPGLRSGESRGFRSNARVRKFHAADHGVNTRVVSSRGFSCAEGFCMLQLCVQEGTASALAVTHPEPELGNEVVRRQDTSRAHVKVAELIVGYLRVLDPEPVAKSLLDVGDEVMRRQDTSRTGVQMEKPFVGYLSMTQVFDSCDLLPVTL